MWESELKKLARSDSSIIFYLIDIYIAKDRLKEALTLLAQTLLKYPMMVQLLFKQALCLAKYKYFEIAVKVSKICCDLIPHSFEAWFLYAECQFELRNIKQGLIALDMAPALPDVSFISLPQPESTYDIQVPIEKNNSDCFAYFMIPSD